MTGPSKPTSTRPAGLEFAMGSALFGCITMLFMVVQSALFVHGVVAMTPALQGRPWMDLFSDPLLRTRMNELIFHGDLVATQAFWSGLVGLAAILIITALWKRRHMTQFLGMRSPLRRATVQWTLVFLALLLLVEGLSMVTDIFHTDFMEQVLSTNTDRLMLILGMGIMAPIFEEFLIRGLLLGSMRHLADEHLAVALSAGVFTLMHMQYSWAVLLLVLPMGVVLGYARTRTGSIWVPVVLHIVNNLLSIALN